MDRLSNILPAVLRKRGFPDLAPPNPWMQAAKRWLEREFPRSYGSLRPLRIEQGVLLIEATDLAMFQACADRSQELVNYLLKTAPDSGIASVRMLRA